jgi:hypothetical protein
MFRNTLEKANKLVSNIAKNEQEIQVLKEIKTQIATARDTIVSLHCETGNKTVIIPPATVLIILNDLLGKYAEIVTSTQKEFDAL